MSKLFQRPQLKLMSFLRILGVVISILIVNQTTVFAQFGASALYTDYKGYWTSSTASINPVMPDNKNNLLGFRWNGTNYSTGVNDVLLATKISFVPGIYQAFPVKNIPLPGTNSNFVGLGQLEDGVDNGGVYPYSVPITVSQILTRGTQGLDMGSCITNIPSTAQPLSFNFGAISNPSQIGDGIPDIVITQVAQATGALDEVYFEDGNGNLVGNKISINQSAISSIGNWLPDFYNPNTGIIQPGFIKTERPIRIWAADASAFGITVANYQQPLVLRYKLGGSSDPAFIAFNTKFITLVTANDDLAATNKDVAVTIDLLSNDIPNSQAMLSSYTVPTVSAHGTIVKNANGTVTYTPNPGYYGQDNFTYSICTNINGTLTCDDAIVTINISPDVAAPVFSSGVDNRCQSTAATSYTARATFATSIAFAVSPNSAGTVSTSATTINADVATATATVTWAADFYGPATITAIAYGSNGPKSSTYAVTVNQAATLVAGANASQTVCAGTSIDPINFTWGGGATDVTVSNLPAGLTLTRSGKVLTISGTPTASGTYTVATVGQASNCGTVTLNGTVTVRPIATLALSGGNANQTICSGSAIAPMIFAWGGSATDVTFTTLPAGLTAVKNTTAKTLTISGTPTVAGNFTVSTVGQTTPCGAITLTGDIVINALAGLTTGGSSTQTVCEGSPITPITYTWSGSATDVTVNNLPAGLNILKNGKVLTISGTPVTGGTFTVNTVGQVAPCTAATATGTINVTVIAAPTTSNQTFCEIQNATVANLAATGTDVKWYSNITGGSALATTTPLVNGTTYYASQTLNGCESKTRSAAMVTITVTAAPTTSNQTFCEIQNATVSNLAATGTDVKWYSNITGGSALATTTPLVNGTTYYASQTLNGCESKARSAATVTITVTAAPTTSNQTFCEIQNATVSNLAATGTDVKWYANITGGSALATTTPLVNGTTYYASQTLNGCESKTRSAAMVTIYKTPQGFNDHLTLDCAGNFSYNIQTANINNTSKGGNAIASTFTWTVNANTHVTGALNGAGAIINQTLINRSNTIQTVIYTITPTSTITGGCVGDNFTVSVSVPVCSSISIAKVADVISVNQAGNTIGYTITVANTGNADQNNVILTDALLGGVLTNPIKTGNSDNILEKGEVWTYTRSYSITQTDLNNNGNPTNNSGKIINTASVQTTELPISQTAIAEVNILLSPSLTLVKKVNGPVPTVVGGVLNYDLVIKNTGNVTLSDLVVTDPKAVVSGSPISTLAPNATVTITASHVLTQSDVDAGTYSNSATVTGKSPSGNAVTDISGTTESNDLPTVVTINPSPSLTLVKTGTLHLDGNSIAYTFIVKNTGNVTLNDLIISDLKITTPLTLGTTTLNPGASTTATALYVITDAEKTTGFVANTANVTGKSPLGVIVTDISGTAENNDAQTIIYTGVFPVNDEGSANTVSGGVAVTDILLNDRVNGNQATLANVNIEQIFSSNNKISIDISTGKVNVQPNTPAGDYTLTYQIEDKNNPGNKKQATIVIHVSSDALAATDDNGVSNTVTGGTAIVNILSNDTYNGTGIAPSLNDVTIIQTSEVLGNVKLDPSTGAVSVLPNTPAGIYEIVYRITDKLDASKTSTAKITITVGSGVLTATNDSGTINGLPGGNAVDNVLDNDTYNGSSSAPTLADVYLTQISTTSDKVVLDITTGRVNVSANTPAGDYIIKYQIVDKLDANQTKQAIVTITVTAPAMVATNDSGSVNGFVGGTAVDNVLLNDTYNGAQATLSNVNLSQVSTAHPNITLDAATGKVNVLPGTPAGSYELVYEIEDKLNPGQKKTAIVTITVTAPAMVAINDSGSVNGFVGGTAVDNVLLNDTYNGAQATLSNVNLSQVSTAHPNITLDVATGKVNVLPGTPAGSYELVYEIEDKLNPGQKKTATITITVGAPIMVATNDSGSVNGFVGGTAVDNVLLNDTYNGTQATLSNVNLSQVSTAHPNITLDAVTGKVNVLPGTPAGSYELVYEIEDKLNPGQKKTATVTITVNTGTILANEDTGVANGFTGGVAVEDILANDQYNGVAVAQLSTVSITQLSTTDVKVSIDVTTGKVNVAAGTQPGIYTLEYKITDKLDISKSSTAKVVVTVPNWITDLQVNKIADVSSVETNGNVSYTISIKNNGPATILAGKAIGLIENLPAGLDNVTYAAVGGTYSSFANTFTLTSDLVSGQQVGLVVNGHVANNFAGTSLVNQVSLTPASGTTDPQSSNDQSSVAVTILKGKIALVKTGVLSADGNAINYSFNITNTGDVDLNEVVLTDAKLGLNKTFAGILAVGASFTYNHIYILSQSEKDAGIVNNTASVTSKTPAGNIVTDISGTGPENDHSTETPILSQPSFTFTKVADIIGTRAAESITYTFTIKNTGNVTLTDLVVADPLVDAGSINPSGIATLAPGASITLTAKHTLSQADLDKGTFANQAILTLKDNKGNVVSKVSDNPATATSDDATVTTLTQMPGYTLTKTATNTVSKAGDVINYSMVFTNTGNVTLSNINLTDAKADAGSLTPATIAAVAPGVAVNITAKHTVTQADVNAGGYSNQASATATDTNGNTISKVSDDPSTPAIDDATITKIIPDPSVRFTKMIANGAGVVKVIEYSIRVTNTGNITLTDIVITDNGADPGSITPSVINKLDPAETAVVSARHTLIQPEIDYGKFVNQASLVASFAGANKLSKLSDDPSTLAPDDATVFTIPESPAITLVKTGVLSADGNTVTYTFTATNRGNVTLNNFNLVDAKILTPVVFAPLSIAPDETATATVIYTITQAEKNAGTVSNTAKITASAPSGTITSDVSGTAENNDNPTIIELPKLTSSKTVSDANNNGRAEAGEVLTYSIVIRNAGNTARTGVKISDPIPANTSYVNASVTNGGVLTNNTLNWNNLTIPANAQVSVSFKVTVDAVITSGNLAINNIASVIDPGNTAVVLSPSVSIPTEGKLEGSKSVSDIKGNKDGKAQANEVLTYSLEVKNTGGTALNGVMITDELPVGLTYVAGSISGYGTVTNNTLKWTINMQANSSTVLTFDAKVAPDVNSYNTLKNVVLMTSPTGLTINPQAVIEVDKSADLVITKELMTKGEIKTGSDVEYKITVTNKGANRATGVTVTDRIPTIIDAPKNIMVTIGTTTYSTTSRDLVWLVGNLDLDQTAVITFKSRTLAAGALSNSATVKGDQPDPVSANNSVLADGAMITGDDLLIPNLFTPNGDGKNDAFEIRGLTEYMENELTIVNRWGNEVFRAKNYQNNWTGEGLNEGTYYYLLKAKKAGSTEWKVFKGYITLIRAFKN